MASQRRKSHNGHQARQLTGSHPLQPSRRPPPLVALERGDRALSNDAMVGYPAGNREGVSRRRRRRVLRSSRHLQSSGRPDFKVGGKGVGIGPKRIVAKPVSSSMTTSDPHLFYCDDRLQRTAKQWRHSNQLFAHPCPLRSRRILEVF